MTEPRKYWGVPAPGPKELRQFSAAMALVLGLIAGYLWYKGTLESARILGLVAGAFLGLGLLAPVALKPLYIAWMWLARLLALVNTHLLLGLVFYTLFTLIGLGMRLFGRDPLDRRLARDQQSYWQRRERPLLPGNHYERQF